ncbi:MAG: hypothetical protein ACJ79R_08450, partial [Anaeromyxobacteraceae bacterium]
RGTAGSDANAPVPFWRAPPFWAGAGGGLAAACAGLAGAGRGLRYLALLDVPAFGWAAWVALRWVAAVEAHGRADRRRRMLEEHERKAEEGFERETAGLREAMAAMGVPGIPELRDSVARLDAATAAVAGTRSRLDAFEAGAEAREARSEKADAEAALRDAEAALAAEAGGYVRDVRSVEMQIARVEAEAAAPSPDAGPPEEAPRELIDPAMLDVGGVAAAAALQARASQIAQALSANRVAGVAVDGRGGIAAVQGGRTVPLAALPILDRDVAFLAIRLALLERALGGGRAVAVAEDVFAVLPEAARKMAARLLRQGVRAGQLLHATSDPAFAAGTEHPA